MTFAFGFHPEAEREFAAAVDRYDAEGRGVGARFVTAIRAAVDAAVDDPDAWTVWPGWDREPVVRSKGVRHFPYRVVFFVHDDVLTVVAVAHTKRRPGYWRDRVAG